MPAHGGSSAVWAAQKVDSDKVAVIANSFVIDIIDFDDADRYMYSANIVSYAIRQGYWSQSDADSKLFSFYQTYANIDTQPSYVAHRMHRVYELLAPSIKMTPFYTDLMRYPFSVTPDAVVSHETMIRVLRDTFEDSDYFDLRAQAVAPGAFGNPNRWSTVRLLCFWLLTHINLFLRIQSHVLLDCFCCCLLARSFASDVLRT
jgi:dipeptidase